MKKIIYMALVLLGAYQLYASDTGTVRGLSTVTLGSGSSTSAITAGLHDVTGVAENTGFTGNTGVTGALAPSEAGAASSSTSLPSATKEVVFFGNSFFALDVNKNSLAYSNDGETWTPLTPAKAVYLAPGYQSGAYAPAKKETPQALHNLGDAQDLINKYGEKQIIFSSHFFIRLQGESQDPRATK